MNRQAHVYKTSKGEEEILTRAHKLKHNIRYVLILVDGTSTVEQILEKGAGLPDVESSLTELAAEGYVTIGEREGPSTHDVAWAKEQLIAIARDILGSDAAVVASKIEGAPDSRDALLEVVSQCKKVVRLTIDEQKAEELLSRCAAVLEHL